MYTHDQQLALDRYHEYLRRAEERRRHRGDAAPGDAGRAPLRRVPSLPGGRLAAAVRRTGRALTATRGAVAALPHPE